MERKEILSKVNELCCEVFDDSNLIITENTVANDIDNWDSFNHVSLILKIEEEFNIKFALGELQTLKNVGVLVDILYKKI